MTIASRNRERGEEAVRRIRAAAPGAAVRFETLDLTDLASVSAFVARLADRGDRLDLLINNAGVQGRLEREETADGLERVFATNARGPFALSARLLCRSADPRSAAGVPHEDRKTPRNRALTPIRGKRACRCPESMTGLRPTFPPCRSSQRSSWAATVKALTLEQLT